MNRRQWLQATAASATLPMLAPQTHSLEQRPDPSPARLPQWRGFNLLSMFYVDRKAVVGFPETDFDLVKELGYNFVRLPMDYRFWVDPKDWTKVREEIAARIDKAVDDGRDREVHVQLNFHRAPGYTVAKPAEELSLWTDPRALDACSAHWAFFASRYKGRPNAELSFNLLNEPDHTVTAEQHRHVIERLAAAIREHDADRLIVCDGRKWGRTPPVELLGLNVAASMHGYDPHRLTHYKAEWVEGSDHWPLPTWPMAKQDGDSSEPSPAELVKAWKALEAQGMGVHVGEFGCHSRTPHPVVLAWMRDVVRLWTDAGWGWALWNLHGSFGILDSRRDDVAYENFHGHKLDRAMLETLKEASA